MQLFFPASVAPQVFAEIAKSPLGVMLLISSVAVLVFFSVTVLAGLVVPTASSPKLSEFGKTSTGGRPPVSGIVPEATAP